MFQKKIWLARVEEFLRAVEEEWLVLTLNLRLILNAEGFGRGRVVSDGLKVFDLKSEDVSFEE